VRGLLSGAVKGIGSRQLGVALWRGTAEVLDEEIRGLKGLVEDLLLLEELVSSMGRIVLLSPGGRWVSRGGA